MVPILFMIPFENAHSFVNSECFLFNLRCFTSVFCYS